MLFSPFQIDDLNSGANPSLTLTIQASGGTLAPITGSGLTINQNGNAITIAGDLADINSALDAGLTYTPAAGVTTNTLTISATDGAGDTAFRTLSIDTSNPAAPSNSTVAPAVRSTMPAFWTLPEPRR